MTTECSKIDELLMDFIYQELEPAAAAEVKGHVDGCARCGAELAALTRTRQAMRSIADVEPPAGVSALLLHEAAKRKPAAAASSAEAGGFWGAIARFFAPIQAHPAMAAVASIVLVAGVAGYLSKRGHVSSKAPAITEAESDEALKLRAKNKDGVEVRLDDDAPSANAPMASAPAEGAYAQPDPTGGIGHAAGEKADSTRGIAGDDARERWGSLAGKEEQKALEPARKKKSDLDSALDGLVGGSSGASAKDQAESGMGYSGNEGKFAQAPKAEAPAQPKTSYRPLDQENSVPPARPRAAQGDDAWSREESEAAGSMALGETSQTKGGGGRASADVKSKPTAPPPAPTSPSTITATPGAAPSGMTAQQQTTRAPSKQQATQSASQLHAEAAKKAKSGSCTEALALRSRLYKVDPTYYDKAVRTDRTFDGCLTAEKRNAKKPAPRDKAMDEAGPSQTDQKSVKQSAH